jgi:acetyl-CoA C-acetyltransferase
MTEVFVYDHVRTPRGRGKKDGALHEVPTPRLAAKALQALRDRNGLDTSTVDDIIMGCVDPVFEAGAVIPKAAAFEAGYSNKAPGMQISRFCASGLDAINFAAGKIAQGADDIVIAGGVESMSAWACPAVPGTWTPRSTSPAISCRRASPPT